jgi:hypothetical protein
MASFSETKEVDKIEVTAMNTIQVRECITVYRDGVEHSRSFQRYVLNPGADLTGQPDKVKAIASSIWTSANVAEYKAQTAPAPIN